MHNPGLASSHNLPLDGVINGYFFIGLSSHRMVHRHFLMNKLKSVQVIVRLHIFLIFSFLANFLSFLLRDDNIFARNENIVKICKRTIIWTDFSNLIWTLRHQNKNCMIIWMAPKTLFSILEYINWDKTYGWYGRLVAINMDHRPFNSITVFL